MCFIQWIEIRDCKGGTMKTSISAFILMIILLGVSEVANAGNIVFLEDGWNISKTPYSGNLNTWDQWFNRSGNNVLESFLRESDTKDKQSDSGQFKVNFVYEDKHHDYENEYEKYTGGERHDEKHDTPPVPEPASIFLLGIGMLAMVGMRRRFAEVIVN
jgi:hypothetical protein